MNERLPFPLHFSTSFPPGDARKVTPGRRYNLALIKVFRVKVQADAMGNGSQIKCTYIRLNSIIYNETNIYNR